MGTVEQVVRVAYVSLHLHNLTICEGPPQLSWNIGEGTVYNICIQWNNDVQYRQGQYSRVNLPRNLLSEHK